MDSMTSLHIFKMAGLLAIAPACKPHTNNIEPYGHDYTYRKGDPCPHGTANKKNGESIKTDRGDRGWHGGSDQSAGAITVGHGGIPTGNFRRRGYRTYLIQRSGHTLHQEQGGK